MNSTNALRPPDTPTGRAAALQKTARNLRLLVIDDDTALLESLRITLEDEGHKVTVASGGQAGIDAFLANQRAGRPFDVVITDFGMPSVDGRQVVGTVRAASPATPIILLTGWGQNLPTDADPPQVNRLLGKPPRMRELRAVLAELTERRVVPR